MKPLRPFDVMFRPDSVLVVHSHRRRFMADDGVVERLMSDRYVLLDLDRFPLREGSVPDAPGSYKVRRAGGFTVCTGACGDPVRVPAVWRRCTEIPRGEAVTWTPWSHVGWFGRRRVGHTAAGRAVFADGRVVEALDARGYEFALAQIDPSPAAGCLQIYPGGSNTPCGLLATQHHEKFGEDFDALQALDGAA